MNIWTTSNLGFLPIWFKHKSPYGQRYLRFPLTSFNQRHVQYRDAQTGTVRTLKDLIKERRYYFIIRAFSKEWHGKDGYRPRERALRWTLTEVAAVTN